MLEIPKALNTPSHPHSPMGAEHVVAHHSPMGCEAWGADGM